MNRINLDFETFCFEDITVVGAQKYTRSPSLKIHCLGYSINSEDPKIFIPDEQPFPADLLDALKSGYLVYAWNAGFEIAVWHEHGVKRLGWPEIPIEQWRDTQAIALMFSYPAQLEKCGDALDLPIKKDKRGSQLINWLCKPQNPTTNHPHRIRTKEHYPELFEELYDYCKQDVRAEMAILDALPWELPPTELELFHLTCKKNIRGLPVDKELVTAVIDQVDNYIADAHALLPLITNGAVTTVNQRDRILDFCESEGYQIDNLQKETVADALDDPQIKRFPKVHSLLGIRQLAGRSSITKYKKIEQAVCNDNRVRDCFKYHRATTGREGGSLLQPQNLPRATVKDPEHAIEIFKTMELDGVMDHYEDVIYTASALIRPSICAPPGYEFIVSDYSQIENRGLLWLAGQEDMLQKIVSGVDPYVDMSAALYNRPYEDILYEYEVEHKTRQRQHGKLTILGCGYGMGYKKFWADCQKKKFDISLDEAKFTVDTFRKKYNEVVTFWYGLQDAAIGACVNQGNITSYGYIKFMYNDGYLFMILPNGKAIAYPGAQVEKEMTPWGQTRYKVTCMCAHPDTGHWMRLTVTPSRLAENATQGMCREIIMEAIIDIEKIYPHIVLTVHDEVGLLVKKGTVTLDEINKILCGRSDTYAGLPLEAEGFVAKRYRK